MAVNVKGIWNCCKAAVPAMRPRAGGGSIVNIASLAATYGMPYGLHYTTSKAAVIGLTRGLARELGRDRIRVNALAPSAVMTEGTREFFGAKLDRALETIKASQTIQRNLMPSDLTGTVAVADVGRQRFRHRPDDRRRWRHGDAVTSVRQHRMQLAGKAALISGAGGGICRAIAVAFAEAGASVACCDIDPGAAAEDRAAGQRGRRPRARRRRCDVAERGRDPRGRRRGARRVRPARHPGQRRRAARSRRHGHRDQRSPNGSWCSTST